MYEGRTRGCRESGASISRANTVEEPSGQVDDRRNCTIRARCMKCNVVATRVRRRIQLLLFGLGCWIQKHNLFTFVTGFIILLGLCVGLKKAKEENNIRKLWVQAGGRLEREMHYSAKFYGEKGFQTSLEAFIQRDKWGSSNILRVEALEEHLHMMQKVMELSVHVHQDQWRLRDLCQKQSFGPVGDSYLHFDRLLEHFTPCHITTPLDCFWEGSKIAGPSQPLVVPAVLCPGFSGQRRKISWSDVNPQQLVEELRAGNFSLPFTSLKRVFERAGITDGYLTKPCLNPASSECPKTTSNHGRLQLPHVGKILTGGCTGVAENIMKWPEDLIVGGAKKNSKGQIISATALQSVIFLLSPKDVFHKYRYTKGRSVPGWSPFKAEQVIKTWQREYTQLVNNLGFNNDSTSTQMMAFSSTSFYDLIKEFSAANLMKIALGYGLMALYAIITLKRWTDSVLSYGFVGLLGVFVVALSVGGALGLCTLLSLSFNAASTQILPFLALGLGVDDMFIIARTYVNISEAGETEEHEILGECLERSGLSITLTSLTNAVAFAAASAVPIPALQDFARQASMVVVFNFFTVLFVFTSTLAFDIKRTSQESYDLLFCFRREQPEPTPQLAPRVLQQDIAFINLDGNGEGPSICAGASVATFIEENKSSPQRSFTIRTENQKNNFGNPWVMQNVCARPCRPQRRSTVPKKQDNSKVCAVLKKLSFSYFADVYFSVWLQSMPIKIFILLAFAVFIGVCAYGALQVGYGLNPSDMVPRNSAEHKFVETQYSYFNFFQIYAVTMENVDYPNNQRLLYEFHKSLEQVNNIVIDKKNNAKPFWLVYFRDWLKDMETTFRKEWHEGRFHSYGWYPNASKEAILGFKLLLVSGNEQNPQNFSRIPHGHLVDANGTISPRCFYYYLTAWYNIDIMGYQVSEMAHRPRPPVWDNFIDIRTPINATEHVIPKSPRIKIALIPFYAMGLRTNKDFLNLIRDFRSVCSSFAKKGLPSYPQGLPFTYWEQYIDLGKYLWISVGLVFAVTFLVLSATLMNVWAAVITVLVLASITFELFGVIGLLGLKLSAVPVVTIIMSVGVGVEFTVHICLAFVSTKGTRNERIKTALTRLFTPIIDGLVSTILGIIMLASSEFDFVRRYFFDVILALVLIGAANGLLLLPVLLSFFGPCCEVTHRRVNPTTHNVMDPVALNLDGEGGGSVYSSKKQSTPTEAFILRTFEKEPVRLQRSQNISNGPRVRAVPTGNTCDQLGGLRSARDPFSMSPGRRDSRLGRTKRQRYPVSTGMGEPKLSPVPEVITPDSGSVDTQSRISASTAKMSRPGTPITHCLPLQYYDQDNEPEDMDIEDVEDNFAEDTFSAGVDSTRGQHFVSTEDLSSGYRQKSNQARVAHIKGEEDAYDRHRHRSKDSIKELLNSGERCNGNYPGKPCFVQEVMPERETTEHVTKVTATATVTVELRSNQSKPHRIHRTYHGANGDLYQGCGLPEPQ